MHGFCIYTALRALVKYSESHSPQVNVGPVIGMNCGSTTTFSGACGYELDGIVNDKGSCELSGPEVDGEERDIGVLAHCS